MILCPAMPVLRCQRGWLRKSSVRPRLSRHRIDPSARAGGVPGGRATSRAGFTPRRAESGGAGCRLHDGWRIAGPAESGPDVARRQGYRGHRAADAPGGGIHAAGSAFSAGRRRRLVSRSRGEGQAARLPRRRSVGYVAVAGPAQAGLGPMDDGCLPRSTPRPVRPVPRTAAGAVRRRRDVQEPSMAPFANSSRFPFRCGPKKMIVLILYPRARLMCQGSSFMSWPALLSILFICSEALVFR